MHSRLVFLGLDGLSWSLAKKLADQGYLPNLSTIINSPGCYPIEAELPELSPVNWTSLFTASAPGEHGVYGFTRINPQTYTLKFTDFTHVHGPTIFEHLGQKHIFSKVLNMPNLGPVRPMPAMVVAGFPSQDLPGSTHPPVLASILSEHEYTIEADTIKGATDPFFLLQDLHRSLNCRQKLLELFWPDLAWDMFMLVLTETDRLGHFLQPALMEDDHPWRRSCLEFLSAWDKVIGQVLTRYADLPGPKRLIMMADHGFTRLEQEVDLNVWLAQNIILHLSRTPENEWDTQCMSPQSLAFALDPGRIYLHTQERFTQGRLRPAEARRLADDLAQALKNLTWKGKRVIAQVHHGQDLYYGPLASQAPDLVLVPEPGFDLKGKMGRTDMFGHFGRQGMHTATDVFYYDSAQENAQTPTHVGQNILHHFGITTPNHEFLTRCP